ncbi:hypothetical protein [Algibacter sp. L4_22]|uniref:hypothetical protein n=1 Tax=Algibacter sp. L4_22 TaxID=2942477 RepID=UPI00201B8849|nr:hypothetical protein [Algibacter sp. L4_22]MCL5128423.1 hypothetical protein [Algibacter sp. L4_22]
MKKYVLAGFIALGSLSMNAQDAMSKSVTLKVGDVIEIGNPSTSKYKYIKFPRANFIIKRNGVADYKGALGEEVVVTDVETINDGNTRVSVKRKDGKRFFNTVYNISISLEKALAANEIKI